jgi:hypothetical protein
MPITVRIARTVEDIFKVFSVRSATYIAEQFCFYDESLTAMIFAPPRFWAKWAEMPRLRPAPVLRRPSQSWSVSLCGVNIAQAASLIVWFGMHSNIAGRRAIPRFTAIVGWIWCASGKCSASNRFEGRPAFTFANVRYVEILAELEPHPAAIRIGLDPMAMIRPEGVWDRPRTIRYGAERFRPKAQGLVGRKYAHLRQAGHRGGLSRPSWTRCSLRSGGSWALFAGVGFLLFGLDDLLVDLVWLGFGRKDSVLPLEEGQRADSKAIPTYGIAIVVPAWDESAVIGAMIDCCMRQWGGQDFRIYIGSYANDPATALAVKAKISDQVRLVTTVHHGPTTQSGLSECHLGAVPPGHGQQHKALGL